MKKRWKKAASLLLALVMVFSILVFPASALGSSQDTDTAEFDIVSQHAENYLKILSTVDQNDISVSINYQNVSIGTPIPSFRRICQIIHRLLLLGMTMPSTPPMECRCPNLWIA